LPRFYLIWVIRAPSLNWSNLLKAAEKLSLSDKERSLLHLDKKEALVKKAEEMWQRFESTGRLTKPTLVIKVDKSDLLALHMYSDHFLPVYKELNAALRNWEFKDPKVKPEDRQKAEEVIFKLKTYILKTKNNIPDIF